MRIPLGHDESEDAVDAARALRARFGFPSLVGDERGWVLCRREQRLELRAPADLRLRPFFVDFTAIDVRTGAGNLSRKQPLARAVGAEGRRILDATAGFGHDAMLLALMGYDVLAVERSAVVAALLEDGVRRAAADPVLGPKLETPPRVIHRESREAMVELGPAVDAVYLDPMFPPKRKSSALPPRSMQIMRHLVGEDADRGELLAQARETAERVVLKRPVYAAPLAPGEAFSVEGKLVRYDVYLRANEGGA